VATVQQRCQHATSASSERRKGREKERKEKEMYFVHRTGVRKRYVRRAVLDVAMFAGPVNTIAYL
jgi:hypothetical protein